jgi:pimeloyl-ACP methyl ester carboxylesterase
MLVGASMGGTASLIAASQDLVDVGAVVTLSAPPSFQGLEVDRDVLFRVFEPKLFLAGQDDFAAARAAQQFYIDSGSPKRVEILPTSDHGSDLLTGGQAEAARGLVLSFLAKYS